MDKHKIKNIFLEGAVAPVFIADAIAKHSTKTAIGGHSIFLGQVRADALEGKMVSAIEYTAHIEMALEIMTSIREEIFAQFPLTCMHVYHSLGKINAGEICLFVFTSSKHRKAAIEACQACVEKIKAELPIWGKELFSEGTHQWKINR